MNEARWSPARSALFVLALLLCVFVAQRALNDLASAAPVILSWPPHCGVDTHALRPRYVLLTALLPVVLGLLCGAFASAAGPRMPQNRPAGMAQSALWRGVAVLPIAVILLQFAAGVATIGLVKAPSVRDELFHFVTGVAWAPAVGWVAAAILLAVCGLGLFGANQFYQAMQVLCGGTSRVH